jgi:vanillate O-demethylase monooxygenase subunit
MPDQATQLTSFWYPVAEARMLRGRPLERRVCGVRLALFRDGDGKPRALDARCPHRGANLADGTVAGGCLVCPYHGWAWRGDGGCARVPSQGKGAEIPSDFAARSYPLVERHGLLWTHVGQRPAAGPPEHPELDDPQYRSFVVEQRVPGAADWWTENFLNVAHVPVTHARTYGGRNPVVTTFPVERRADELGFTTRIVIRHEYGLWTRLIHGGLAHFTEDIRVEHRMPGATFSLIDMGKGRRQGLWFLATPEDGETSRIFFVVLRNYLRRAPFGDAVGRRFARKVIAEDVRVVERAVSTVSVDAPPQLSTPADDPAVEHVRLVRLWRERERRENRGWRSSA